MHDALVLLHEADNQGDQALVAGALRNIAVELAIGPQVGRLAGPVAFRIGRVRGLIERAQAFGIDPAGGEPHDGDVEHEAELENLLNVAERDGGDRVALASARDDQPLLPQAHQGAAGWAPCSFRSARRAIPPTLPRPAAGRTR